MSDEQVLVIPTAVFHDAGVFQGFSADLDRYLPRLLEPRHFTYRPRSEVETDPSFKQLIPYVVLKHGDLVFHYTRGKKATETRLVALRSLGVGGHISRDDGGLFDSPYREAMFREVREEVELDSAFQERCIGLINDDSAPVGQVHLGIVHVFELESPSAKRREAALTQAGFSPWSDLHMKLDEFETWSRFLLEGPLRPSVEQPR